MPRKPGLWAVERGAIDPQHRHLWKDLKLCLPFLGMEVPTDVAGNHLITQVGSGLVYGAYMAPGVGYDRDGISMMFDDSAADNYLTTDYDPVLAGDFTVLVRVNAQPVITPDFTFIGAIAEKGADDPGLIIHVETAGADRYQYFVRDEDGNSTGFTDFIGAFDDDLDAATEGTADNLVVVRRGSVVHGYWQGVDTTVSGITGVIDLSDYPFYIAARNDRGSASGEDMEGSISLVAIWERALSVGEIAQLDADPWSFLRPIPAAYKTVAVGGTTVTPGAIAATVALPDATTIGGAVTTPGDIARSFTLPPAVTVGSAVVTPGDITRSFLIPATTAVGSAVVTPGEIGQSFTLPAVTLVTGVVVTPAEVSTAVAVDPVTILIGGTIVSPVELARSFGLPAAIAVGGAVVVPAGIARSFTLPAATTAGGAVAAPAEMARSFLLPAATPIGPALVTPGEVITAALLPAAIAIGGGAATVTPATIALAVGFSTVTILIAPTVGGDWWQLVTILEEVTEPELVACPNDGEPLLRGPNNTLYCPYDGWYPPPPPFDIQPDEAGTVRSRIPVR